MNSRGFTNVAVIITQDVHVPSKHHDASGDPFLPVKIHKITSCETLQLLCIWIAKFLIYYTLFLKNLFGPKKLFDDFDIYQVFGTPKFEGPSNTFYDQ